MQKIYSSTVAQLVKTSPVKRGNLGIALATAALVKTSKGLHRAHEFGGYVADSVNGKYDS